MVKLLIMADDFTGALDTGVQFAARNIPTRVASDQNWENACESGECCVLVIDTETRHLPEGEAYEAVFHITETAVKKGIPYLYKKTDSALRGNVGSELTALYEASHERFLPFLPALPAMNRIVKNGILYIDDIPVRESVFGQDPFNPVKHSRITDIISSQSSIPMEVSAGAWDLPSLPGGICIYDSQTEIHMKDILSILKREKKLRILAGCAGCAALLPEILDFDIGECERIHLPEKLLVVCGSMNPITKRQLDYAEQCGFVRICFRPEEKLNPEFWKTPEGTARIDDIYKICMGNQGCILDSNDKTVSKDTEAWALREGIPLGTVSIRISESMGAILKLLLERQLNHTLMITGGDTLSGFMKQIGTGELSPLREVFPGCVLTRMESRGNSNYVITKSGGFGKDSLISDIRELLENQGGKYEAV